METALNVGTVSPVKGCITQESQILGRTPQEMENLLGFEAGYLGNGAIICALIKLPKNTQFALARSYTTVPTNEMSARAENATRFTTGGNEIEQRIMKRNPLDTQKTISRNGWSDAGINRLVKIKPVHTGKETRISPGKDVVFPPGQGVKQWVLLEEMEAKVIAVLGYHEKHVRGL